MTQNEDPFERDVSACVKALNEHLPEIAARHTGTVLLAALTEHVGGALQILMSSGECSPEQARKLLAELERLVFAEGLSASSPAGHPPAAVKGT
jgi:hypothetical protein